MILEEIKKHFTCQESEINFHERQQRLVEITPEAKFSCLLTLWPWESYLISLGFNFTIYKMKDLEDKNARTLLSYS